MSSPKIRPTIIDIGEYKRELISDILENPNIVVALNSKHEEVPPIEEQLEDPSVLVYKNVFPFLLIPEFENTVDAYIMIGVDSEEPSWRFNQTYADYQISIWVMSHKANMECKTEELMKWREILAAHKQTAQDLLPTVATRIDYIAQLILRMLAGTMKYGFAPMQLASSREVVLNNTFYYRELIFETRDLRKRVEDNQALTDRTRARTYV